MEIRLGAADSEGAISPAETVRLNLEKVDAVPAPAFLKEILPVDNSIWRSLKELQLTQLTTLKEDEEPPTILLVFDQFEELFTYTPAQQLAFRRELAEVLHTRLPQRYWDMLGLYEGDDAPFTDREKQHLLRGLRVHVVTAIREDRMHLLGSLADYLPTISKNWFELKHLDRDEAIRAIEAPAAHKGAFSTAPFSYEPAVRDAIITYLSKGEGGIESTQLQVICDALDRRLAGKKERTVTPALMGDLKMITAQFYQDKLAEIEDPDQRLIARKLVENELIYAQARRRLSLFSGQIYDYGVSPDTLRILVDGHLLRAEPDLKGGYNYEVSHDSLVDPILEARGEREVDEAETERLRLEREAEVERERVAEEQIRKMITGEFYRDILTKIEDPDQRLLARNLVEDEMIFERRRLMLFSERIYIFGVRPETLRILVDGHLLRAEPNLQRGGYNYEVSHDSLVDPILKAREARKVEEAETERLHLEREAEAERLRVAEEHARVMAVEGERKVRRLNGILMGLLAAAVLAVGVAFYFSKEAGLKEKEAQEQADLAEAVLDKIYFYEGEFGVATEESRSGIKFGFINKKLETKIEFKYNEAHPFDDFFGFAKVKRGEKYYFIDTTGREFLLATEFSSVRKKDVQALDISNTRLGVLSRMLRNYPNLKILYAYGLGLTDIEELANLTDLQTLDLHYNSNLTNINALANLTSLHTLDLSNNSSLANVDALANLTALQTLDLHFNSSLTNIDSLAKLSKLKTLYLSYNSSLTNVGVLENLTALKMLDLSNSSSLMDVDILENLTALQTLSLRNNSSLINVDGLAKLTNLKTLYLSYNLSLTNVDILEDLTALKTLDLSNNLSLINVDGLAKLTNLKTLYLSSNSSLTNVDVLANLTNLQELDLSENGSLTNVDGLSNLTNLQTLSLINTPIPKEKLQELVKALPNCKISY
nr:leucine-rich repeat domain-containing protein [Neolewinella persica]